MAQFHFVEDYRRLVRHLSETLPRDEAMSRAVGGHYERIGLIEAQALRHAGLQDGMAVLDFGCGSGRLAWALSQTMSLDYLGLDVVQELLDYAAERSPEHYRFQVNEGLTLPGEPRMFDMVSAFSVFTHLLHHESFLYLQEMRRVLKPGGRVVFSFLEFGDEEHWPVFASTMDATKASTLPHLNQFIERSTIEIWARRLFMNVVGFVSGTDGPWGEPGRGNEVNLGQALAILEKPPAAATGA